jgi:hypothetical protein
MPATYEPIATTTLVANTSTITFSSIPSTYTDLKIVAILIGRSTVSPQPSLRFNGDTATNYSQSTVRGTGSAYQNSNEASVNYMNVAEGGALSSTIPSLVEADIFSYRGSTYKAALGRFSNDLNGSGIVTNSVGVWRSTAAITSVSIFDCNGNSTAFAIGSVVTLYGIKAA